MPKYTYQFKLPAYFEAGIVDHRGRKKVTIRVKPVSIAWKPASSRDFLTVPMDDFIAWITGPQARARVTKS